MAEMIPDHLPAGTSRGEKRLFDILQNLPDDCIVYYEPVVANRYPDFVVILPDQGLLVLEVKGWLPYQISGADANDVKVNAQGKEQICRHPVRQAREYMYALMDKCRAHTEYSALVHQGGTKEGKFIFPFGNCAILSQMTSEALQTHSLGNLTPVFDSNQVKTAEVLEEWSAMTSEQLKETFGLLFNPKWSFPPLTKAQVDILREVLHPEIRISPPPADWNDDNPVIKEIKVLDLEQEKSARSIGSGHRIIHGVAGSGKTVLLIARAKLLSQNNPDSRILVLTYNVALAAYLKKVLSKHTNIAVFHFHGWAKANSVFFDRNETNEEFGNRFLEKLTKGDGQAGVYDAVLVDEAQDFAPAWFKVVLAAMKEPVDGDLLVVGDASQGLYLHGRRLSWRSLGVHAVGRTRKLERNYRNTLQILKAASYVAPAPMKDNPDGLSGETTDPGKGVRTTGLPPLLLKASDRDDECRKVVSLVENLLAGKWADTTIAALRPEDIGIFYPRIQPKWLFDPFMERLQEIAPVVWISDPKNMEKKERVCEPGIKIQTIHSAKGLQYRAVILMFAQELVYSMPSCGPERDEKLEDARRLLYVGLTRAEDYLAVSFSDKSVFTDQMIDSGYFTQF